MAATSGRFLIRIEKFEKQNGLNNEMVIVDGYKLKLSSLAEILRSINGLSAGLPI